jgi:hypothetical protein
MLSGRPQDEAARGTRQIADRAAFAGQKVAAQQEDE